MTDTAMSSPLGLDGADAAMRRAAEDARQLAARTGTPLAHWRDGRVVRIPADAQPTPATSQPPIVRT